MSLEGDLVVLRAVEWEDLPAFVRWLNDPLVTEHLLSNPLVGLEDQERWYQDIQGTDDRVMSITTKEGKLIGDCGITRLEWEDRRCNLWLMIGEKEYWGRGYGTDTVRTMLRYLFDELNMNRVCLIVAEDNIPAIKAYEKCGFRRDGVLRRNRFKLGSYRNDVSMSILHEEWQQMSAQSKDTKRDIV